MGCAFLFMVAATIRQLFYNTMKIRKEELKKGRFTGPLRLFTGLLACLGPLYRYTTLIINVVFQDNIFCTGAKIFVLMKKRKDKVKDFLVQVGDNIRRSRVKRGLTLEALGDDIGLDKSNMFRIEQGKNITLVTLMKIAAFLDVHPSRLLQNTPDILMEDAEEYVKQK